MSEEEKVTCEEQQAEPETENKEEPKEPECAEAAPQEAAPEAPAQEDYKDKWLRVTAEYQNYRTRTQKEKADIYANANEAFVKELLEVVDNFERAMEQKPEGDKFAEGIELIYKQLLTILEKEHVKEIPALGEDFNPTVHMAVQMMEVEGLDSDKVAIVIKKGYTLNDKVIRPAMVVVSQ